MCVCDYTLRAVQAVGQEWHAALQSCTLREILILSPVAGG